MFDFIEIYPYIQADTFETMCIQIIKNKTRFLQYASFLEYELNTY